MLDDYFANHAAQYASLDQAAGERLDALAAMYGVARVESRWRGGFNPILFGDVVAEVVSNDLREWMTMTCEQRGEWMARALRDRRAASSEQSPSRLPRTALGMLGPSMIRLHPPGQTTITRNGRTDRLALEVVDDDDEWILCDPPGATP